jgi:hypothetical protein
MRRWPAIFLMCGAVLVAIALLPAGRALSEQAQRVLVVNLPARQAVEGTVSIEGPVELATPVPLTSLHHREEIVPPTGPREDTAQLLPAGTLRAEGFRAVVLSVVGQMRSAHFRPGEVGAILVPDAAPTREAFDQAGRLLLPLDVSATPSPGEGGYFGASREPASLAFPSYRVYLYNTSDQPAALHLYAYLTN